MKTLAVRLAYSLNLPLLPSGPKLYRETRELLKNSEYWNEDKIQAYQAAKLRKTLEYAYHHIPYYRKTFSEAGFHPESFRHVDDLRRLPFLTKRDIQNNTESMLSEAIPKASLEYYTTGGSTGIPMGLYGDKLISYRENAYIDHMWARAGYTPGDRVAVLRGAFTGAPHFIAVKNGQLLLSSYHLTDENLPQYIDAIRDFSPRFLHVYASSIYLLCDYMKRNNIAPFPSLKAVLSGSESVYQHQRNLVEKTLQCRFFSHYGHCEQACLAGECEYSTDYHIFWQYGFTELLNSRDENVSGEGEAGEIVATTFDNFAMPLIRYRTMDIAENTLRACACGRTYKLISRVKGRLQEALVTTSGRYISMTSINMHSDVFDNVAQFQFYQEDPSYCVFNVVRRSGYTQDDEEHIKKELKKKLGWELELKIRYVDEIPRTPSGKFRFLIQKLPVLFTEDVYND
jgi:phenylacetate-CoA ligase